MTADQKHSVASPTADLTGDDLIEGAIDHAAGLDDTDLDKVSGGDIWISKVPDKTTPSVSR